MHLVLVISSLSPGGAERILSELANHWVSKDHHISLITLMPPEVRPFYYLDPRVDLIRLKRSKIKSSLIRRPLNVVRSIYYLRKTIRQLNPDAVVSFIDLMNVATIIATIGCKIPVIISERIDPAFHPLPKVYTWLRLKLYPLSTRLVVQTESVAQYFPKNFRHFLSIIPNPVKYPEYRKEGIQEKVRNIIAVGRLDPQKDHITLIQAFSNIIKYYPDLILTIYGEGKERENLEELVASLGLENKVLFPGAIQNIHQALISADLFIFPSRYEGFPNALCEAMAVGLPVIASDCSGNVDIVSDGNNGRLFPVGNVQALSSIMLELLGSAAQRAELAKQAQNVCISFHSEQIFGLWDEVIYKAQHP